MTADVTAPDGTVQVFLTRDGSIKSEASCLLRIVKDTPDYAFSLPLSQAGTYRVRATAKTPDGDRYATINLSVGSASPMSVVRSGPTRGYLGNVEQITLSVTARKTFTGTLTDTVPAGWTVTDISAAGVQGRAGNATTITWDRKWTAGETVTLSYAIQSRAAEPTLSTLGPIEMRGEMDATAASSSAQTHSPRCSHSPLRIRVRLFHNQHGCRSSDARRCPSAGLQYGRRIFYLTPSFSFGLLR